MFVNHSSEPANRDFPTLPASGAIQYCFAIKQVFGGHRCKKTNWWFLINLFEYDSYFPPILNPIIIIRIIVPKMYIKIAKMIQKWKIKLLLSRCKNHEEKLVWEGIQDGNMCLRILLIIALSLVRYGMNSLKNAYTPVNVKVWHYKFLTVFH